MRGRLILAIILGVCVVTGCKPGCGASKAKIARDAGATGTRDAAVVSETLFVDVGPKNATRGVVIDPRGQFFEVNDAPIRASLATSAVVDVERGFGGRSVAFKLKLADGTQAYFKPEQSFSAAHWYAELAAYYLDRELGIGRVAPAIGRMLPWKLLEKSAPADAHFEEAIVQQNGYIRGAIQWWVPEKLVAIRPGGNWERWLRIRGTPPSWISPFQRAKVYMDALARAGLVSEDELEKMGGVSIRSGTLDGGVASVGSEPSTVGKPKTPDTPDRVAELSDIILFDYLILNLDRWGGDFTNVRTRGEGGPLMYLDNAAGFSPHQASNGIILSRLHAVEKFRKSTVESIRNLNIKKLKERMDADPMAPLLDDEAFGFLDARRNEILEHVEAMQKKYGDQVFAF